MKPLTKEDVITTVKILNEVEEAKQDVENLLCKEFTEKEFEQFLLGEWITKKNVLSALALVKSKIREATNLSKVINPEDIIDDILDECFQIKVKIGNQTKNSKLTKTEVLEENKT